MTRPLSRRRSATGARAVAADPATAAGNPDTRAGGGFQPSQTAIPALTTNEAAPRTTEVVAAFEPL
jgi:hypothetical protein